MRIMWIFKATLFGAVAVMINGDSYPQRCYPGLCQQMCVDSFQGYQCRCMPGFYVNPSNSRTCLPVAVPGCPTPNPCEQLCISQGSGYRCGCRNGFYLDPQNPVRCIAVAVPGCPTPNPCEQLCISQGSGYRCGCRNGFYLDPQNPVRCIAMNTNTNTSTNTCGPGYTVDPASPNGCKDIDECLTPRICQQKCDNLPGNFRCTCNRGYVVSATDNTKCKQFQLCTGAVDVVLVIDSTDGIGYNNFQLLLSFVSEISRHFQIGGKRARFGAIQFSDMVHLLFGLDDYKTSDRISTEILAAPYMSGVAVNFEVFDYIRKKDLFNKASGGRPNVRDYVIVFTAGRSSSVDLTRAAAENLKNTGVEIIVVGIGDNVSQRELASIAGARDHLLLVPDFYHIENIQEKLVALTCPGYED